MRQWNRCVRVWLVLVRRPHCFELKAKSERGTELKYNTQFFSKIAPLSLGYQKSSTDIIKRPIVSQVGLAMLYLQNMQDKLQASYIASKVLSNGEFHVCLSSKIS